MALKSKIAKTSSAGSLRGKSMVVANSAILKRVWGKNNAAAGVYIHVLDLAALPAEGAVTHKINPMYVGAGFEFNMDFTSMPILFTYGICIYASSTENNKTIIAGDDIIATMQYEDAV